MVLKRAAALFFAAAMLMFAWMPVAFIVNSGFDGAHRRMSSILQRGSGSVSSLPASRLDAADFLYPRLVPTLEPEALARADAASSPGRAPEAPAVRLEQPRTRAFPSDGSRRPYARLIERAADRHGVDPNLVHALIEVESSYRPDAVSTAGAMGLMQLMPHTARRYGVGDPLDPEANIEAGTRHLRVLLDEFGPLFALNALAAYHAGEEVVRRHGGIPPYPQTQMFVRRVLDALLSQTGWSGGD